MRGPVIGQARLRPRPVIGRPGCGPEPVVRQARLRPRPVVRQPWLRPRSLVSRWPAVRAGALAVAARSLIRRRSRHRLAVPDLGDRPQELPGVRRPQVGIAAGGHGHQGVDGAGQPGQDARRGGHDLVHVLVGHRQRTFAGMRLPPGEQLEQHDARRIHIGARVGRPAGHLFGRQVGGRSDDHSALGLHRPGDRSGQPEVGDLHRARGRQQHVLRLDVTVREAGLMRGLQPGQDAAHDVQRLAGAEPAALVQQLTQRPAGNVLHRDVVQPLVRALVEDGDHVRAGQPRRRPCLADEPAHELGVVGQLGVRDLERDHAVKPRVRAEIHGRHATPRDARVNVVPAAEQLAHGWRKGGVHRQQCRGSVTRLSR